MRSRILPLLAILALTAGCLGTDTDDIGDEQPTQINPDWYEHALPDDHDHEDPHAHQDLSTPNFNVLGWNPLETEYHGHTSGDYFCGEIATEGDRDIAIMHSISTDVGAVIVDVTDPAEPTLLSEIVLPYASVRDTAITPDGNYAAFGISELHPLATEPDDGLPLPTSSPWDPRTTLAEDDPKPLTAEITNYCAEEPTTRTQVIDETPYSSGTILIDLADPEEPEIADWVPEPVLGPHSIHAQHVNGEPRILSTITNLAHQTAYYDFFLVEETPNGPALVLEHRYQAHYPENTAGEAPPLMNGHNDGWIEKHPVEDAYYAYLANWDGGVHILEHDETTGVWDVIAIWNDYDPDNEDDPTGFGKMTGQWHTTLPMKDIDEDGNHYTWIGQEVINRPAERPTGNIIKMDTTDPTNPEPVARWTLPVDLGTWDESLEFSTHYLRVVDNTAFVAMYHGGVWAVGTDPIEGTHQLPSKGAFIPDHVPPNPPDRNLTMMDHAPTVLDVMVTSNDELVIFDGFSGVYTVAYDETMEVPIPDPWTADGWSPDQGELQPLPP